ncbi:MAG: ABC transporter permease [Pseudomonadota bacterium]
MFLTLLWRDIRSRFINSYTGWLWLLINPLLLLAVYAFVFGVIFRARVPEGLDVPFVVWLSMGLWPWLAFADGVLRASDSMPQYKALISKVAIPRELLVLSSATSAFLMQLLGCIVVLILVAALGTPVHWSGLPLALLIMIILYGLCCGLGLIMAALRVYFRDLEQLLPTLLMFAFFLTPIIYSPDMLPEQYRDWWMLNPMAQLLTELRSALLEGQWLPSSLTGLLLFIAIGMCYFGLVFFRRLSPYFEDFL